MFTPYYFLAVGFGIFAVVVSAIGMKKPNDFPGKFMPLVILLGVAFGVATFAFVWHGGEQEKKQRNEEKAAKAMETGSVSTLPATLKYVS
jgi:flagellar basal body-associated protein FliL